MILILVTAEEAIQDRLNAKRARLSNVQGDVTLKDGTWVSGTAPSRAFWMRPKKLLTLTGASVNALILSDNGVRSRILNGGEHQHGYHRNDHGQITLPHQRDRGRSEPIAAGSGFKIDRRQENRISLSAMCKDDDIRPQ